MACACFLVFVHASLELRPPLLCAACGNIADSGNCRTSDGCAWSTTPESCGLLASCGQVCTGDGCGSSTALTSACTCGGELCEANKYCWGDWNGSEGITCSNTPGESCWDGASRLGRSMACSEMDEAHIDLVHVDAFCAGATCSDADFQLGGTCCPGQWLTRLCSVSSKIGVVQNRCRSLLSHQSFDLLCFMVAQRRHAPTAATSRNASPPPAAITAVRVEATGGSPPPAVARTSPVMPARRMTSPTRQHLVGLAISGTMLIAVCRADPRVVCGVWFPH